jgi:hypothetical protein
MAQRWMEEAASRGFSMDDVRRQVNELLSK